MIVFLICASLVPLGLILYAISALIIRNKDLQLCGKGIALGFSAFGLLLSVILGIIIASVQINVKIGLDYELNVYKKSMLEHRLSKQDELDENGIPNYVSTLLYDDILTFNNSLRVKKTYANLKWTNWFINKDVATIDYIKVWGEVDE